MGMGILWKKQVQSAFSADFAAVLIPCVFGEQRLITYRKPCVNSRYSLDVWTNTQLVCLCVFIGSVSEGGGRFSPSEALRARAGSEGRHGETEELQPHQR